MDIRKKIFVLLAIMIFFIAGGAFAMCGSCGGGSEVKGSHSEREHKGPHASGGEESVVVNFDYVMRF